MGKLKLFLNYKEKYNNNNKLKFKKIDKKEEDKLSKGQKILCIISINYFFFEILLKNKFFHYYFNC